MWRRAVLFRAGESGTAWEFGDPGETLRGNLHHSRDAARLARAVDAIREEGRDSPLPAAAWVGVVGYEGGFIFTRFGRPRVLPAEELLPPRCVPPAQEAGTPWACSMDRDAYTAAVRRAQEHIAAGDIYQANVARMFSRPAPGLDPRELFRVLWQVTGAPMAACLEGENRAVLSASPELFLSITGRRVVTRPIKGTRPRDPDPLRDMQLALELAVSPKEVAELVMITDLLRNDLGRVCGYGSVRVPELARRESFSHVHHLVSTVEGDLRPEVGAVRALAACFPGGSITGAPKLRAMEIIGQLEAAPRGIYTGSIGWFGSDGTAQFNIAIRTLEWRDGVLSFGAGSGITADSVPEEEYRETGHKAAALRQAVAMYEAALRGAPARP